MLKVTFPLDRGDGTGEALAGILRPGNAGSNTAADHIEVSTWRWRSSLGLPTTSCCWCGPTPAAPPTR